MDAVETLRAEFTLHDSRELQTCETDGWMCNYSDYQLFFNQKAKHLQVLASVCLFSVSYN